jgi:hypothetical protein
MLWGAPFRPQKRGQQWSIAMKLIDQSAVPPVMRAIRPGTKINHTPKRKDFETVAAAVRFAMTELSAGQMPEIKASCGVALQWADIEALSKKI